MNRLSLRVRRSWDGRDITDIFIDGRNLVDMVREIEEEYAKDQDFALPGEYEGLPARYCFLPSRHFLDLPSPDLPTADGKVIILGCACGVPEDWPLLGRITMSVATVQWGEFENFYEKGWNQEALGRFQFLRTEYEAELASQSGPWAEKKPDFKRYRKMRETRGGRVFFG